MLDCRTASSPEEATHPCRAYPRPPFPPIDPQLGVPFPVRREAPHVVNLARQVWAGVIGAGPDGRPLEVRIRGGQPGGTALRSSPPLWILLFSRPLAYQCAMQLAPTRCPIQ